jgi:chromosome partitioning protein
VVALVAWVSQKGGVSKSTLARALAVEAGRGGLKVKIADLDPGQGSTTDWHQDRVAAQLEPHIAVELFPTPKAAITAASPSYSPWPPRRLEAAGKSVVALVGIRGGGSGAG